MKTIQVCAGALAFSTALTVPFSATLAAPAAAQMDRYNHPGNLLISDQFNNRVIETDQAGNILWHSSITASS